MNRIACISVCLLASVGCGVYEDPNTDSPPDTDDPECQIQTEGEKWPGYPFDLELFANQVLPVLADNCSAAGCHAPPAGSGNFTVWASAAPGTCEYAKTFNSLKAQIDLASPDNSALLIAIRGDNPAHPVSYTADDARLQSLDAYVRDASESFHADGGGGDQAPPGASPFDYAVFQQRIQPILDTAEGTGCATAGCHGTGAGNMVLTAGPAPDSAEMEANFIAVTARTNLDAPEASLLYLKATARHGNGASAVASPDQAVTLLDWIVKAKEAAGDGGDPTCAPIESFNLGVFRDEVFPLLAGDVDLNNPGSGLSTTGCVRGPCHGTDRGPGTLYLSQALDASQNLRNFSCFVKLTNPSASEILLCPLDAPGCRRSPHPGQDVFGGARDLNYQRVLAYLYGSKVQASPLDYAFFVRRINPIFNDLQAVEGGAQGRSCADAVSCHGVNIVGQAPPNGSNFPIIPNAADPGRMSFNFVSAGNFSNFLNPTQSSLFLYPTNEIANLADNPLATGLPHPGGTDFAVDSQFARDIVRWAGGLRPDADGFVRDWLVAGDYAATLITDFTPIDESGSTPRIFDAAGGSFNSGEWDGLFADDRNVDLNRAFPRDGTNGRIAYAVAYLVNTTSLDITAQVTIDSPNAARLYVGNTLVAQSDGGQTSAIAAVPSFGTAATPTRLMIKLLQRAGDQEFEFTLQLRDELGNLLTDTTGELVIVLGPEGGI